MGVSGQPDKNSTTKGHISMDEVSAGILVVTLLSGLAIARAVRKKAAVVPELPPPPPEVVEAPPAAAKPQTLREKRLSELEERSRQGICAYCREPALHQRPRRVKVRGLFDDLIRALGGTPQEVWRVKLKFDLDTLPSLCDAHHAQYLARLNAKIAEMDQKRLVLHQSWLDEFHEFEAFALDEQMNGEARRVLRGETRPPIPPSG
jgi:hypothetical protein